MLVKRRQSRAGKQTDSHVAIGVDATVFLHILHLCWVNMLNLLNSLGLGRQIVRDSTSYYAFNRADCANHAHTHRDRGVPAAGQAPAGWSRLAGQAQWSGEGQWRWSQRLLRGSAWRLESTDGETL